jgi:methyl-accepting chemotaxis protein
LTGGNGATFFLETTVNLDNALAAHAQWKTKLRGAIQKQEKLDTASIGVDHKCEFGQWLHGAAKSQYGTLEGYRNCVATHAAFHRQAGSVATAINAARYDEAAAMLDAGTPYATASAAVGTAIIRLRKEAGL